MTKLLLLLSLAGVCAADIIDFTDGSFASANGKSSQTFNYSGHTLTLSADPAGAELTYNPGIGIKYGLLDEVDEIDFPEVLSITFASQEYLSSFTVSNMRWQLLDYERGYYSLNGGQWIGFTGASSGQKVISVGKTVQSISFAAPIGVSEYTLKSMNVTRVPEESAVGVLGLIAGGALLALRRRNCLTA